MADVIEPRALPPHPGAVPGNRGDRAGHGWALAPGGAAADRRKRWPVRERPGRAGRDLGVTERVTGIEPAPPAWKASSVRGCRAVVLHTCAVQQACGWSAWVRVLPRVHRPYGHAAGTLPISCWSSSVRSPVPRHEVARRRSPEPKAVI